MRRSITFAASLVVAVAPLGATSSVAAPSPWAALHRPLTIPHLAPGSPCPVTRAHRISSDFGRVQGHGPVYPVIDSRFPLGFAYPVPKNYQWYPSAWGGQKVLWVGSPSYTGPVLIRGRQLDGAHLLRFGSAHSPSPELHLTVNGASSQTWQGREWPSYTRLRAPGCYGWQVDGSNFSDVIVFRAAVYPK